MSGNGADIGTVITMLGEVLRTQHEQGQIIGEHTRILAEHTRILGGHTRALADLGAGLADLRTAVVDLRTTVGHYHASVLGHGILISELEARVRRLEDHLKLPPIAA